MMNQPSDIELQALAAPGFDDDFDDDDTDLSNDSIDVVLGPDEDEAFLESNPSVEVPVAAPAGPHATFLMLQGVRHEVIDGLPPSHKTPSAEFPAAPALGPDSRPTAASSPGFRAPTGSRIKGVRRGATPPRDVVRKNPTGDRISGVPDGGLPPTRKRPVPLRVDPAMPRQAAAPPSPPAAPAKPSPSPARPRVRDLKAVEEGKALARKLIGAGILVWGPDLRTLLDSLNRPSSPERLVLARFITDGPSGQEQGYQFGVQIRGVRYRKALQYDLVEVEGVLRRVRSPSGERLVELGLAGGVPIELPTYSTSTRRGYFVARESLPEHRMPRS